MIQVVEFRMSGRSSKCKNTDRSFNGVDYLDTPSSFLGTVQLCFSQISSPIRLTQLLESSKRSQDIVSGVPFATSTSERNIRTSVFPQFRAAFLFCFDASESPTGSESLSYRAP